MPLHRRTLLAASTLACAVPRAARAGAVVRWLHIEQNSDIAAFYADVARQYEALHPGVKVQPMFLENESFKKKLTTLLQSRERPHLVYSWGGGVLREQVRAGVVEDLGRELDREGWRQRYAPSLLQPYTVAGRCYGVPMLCSQVGFFYNKALLAKAGVAAEGLRSWDDFLAAVKKLQAAGITPLVAGGADKWTLHFYWSHLALRLGGRAAFDAAMQGGGEGFAAPAFVRAGELFKQLCDLKPFQPGYLAASYPQSAGQFGDGKGAMTLMIDALRPAMATNAADKRGVPDAQLGWFPFPAVPGGTGGSEDTLGGLNGWMVTKGAPPEAIDFLRFFTEARFQAQAAEQGWFIPVVNGAREKVQHPILRRMADNVARAPYHQLFYDQMLGPTVGAVLNDVSADLAAGRLGAREAAQQLQAAWRLAR